MATIGNDHLLFHPTLHRFQFLPEVAAIPRTNSTFLNKFYIFEQTLHFEQILHF